MSNSNCYAKLYKSNDFSDDKHTTFSGPANIPNLEDVHWPNTTFSNDMKDDTSAIKTGSQAWVRIYSKANYGGRTKLLQPNTSIEDLKDISTDGSNWDDTIESLQIYDHKPAVDTQNVINNFAEIYKTLQSADYNRKDNLYNSYFYSQDSEYRVYDPSIIIDGNVIQFTMNAEHIQLEKNDHAVVTFTMDFYGNFVDKVKVTYEMGDATQIPDWAIKLIDGAIDVADDIVKLIFDGTEIVLTDGVGVVATVETNKVIDYTAKALTFCVDHLNTVLKAIFTYQDDGGTMNFSAVVSHSIARLIKAYYQELYGSDTNPMMSFSSNTFLSNMGKSSWDNSKDTEFIEFSTNGYSYRSYKPDNSFYYAKGGAISTVKLDAITNISKDDHLILQTSYSPDGKLFSIIGSIDIFSRSKDDDYVSPCSGVLMYNSDGQMVNIAQDGTITNVNYASLQDAYADKMTKSLTANGNQFDIDITDNQKHLVDASLKVINATIKSIN